MKHPKKLLCSALLVLGLQLGYMTGCAGGYVATGGGVYYGGDPWIHNDVIVEGGGHPWYGGHADHGYVHPGGGGRRR